jgi:hypothetical protein
MSTTVFADVIFEPKDNFYTTHKEECEYVKRYYIAGSANGYTNVYVSPKNGKIVTEVPNGEEIYISWQWNEWLYCNKGWLHSDDVSLKYDSISFLEEHKTTDYNDKSFSVSSVQMYTYPNSGECYEMTEVKEYASIGDSFNKLYIDDAGLMWGYIGYYMQRSGWVCIDDPVNTSLKSGELPVEKSVSQMRSSDAVVEAPKNYLPIATGLVVLVVAITSFLLLRKKKR